MDAWGNTGHGMSLALDALGNPHLSYTAIFDFDLRYATKVNGNWRVEDPDPGALAAGWTSIEVDESGQPWISYENGGSSQTMRVARKNGGLWQVEILDDGIVASGRYGSLALDSQGNPRVSYYDPDNTWLRYASTAIEATEPNGGDSWPVGAARHVRWNGSGVVDFYLSLDGGNTWELQETALLGGSHLMTVPHSPTRFAQITLERAIPFSSGKTESLFTIETDIALLSLKVAPPLETLSGAVVSWSTDPGPEDLGGYRLDKAVGTGSWNTLVALTRATSFHDVNAGPGTSYRLYGVNGLGQELLLGEVTFLPAAPLLAWPLPYRSGDLQISFSSFGGRGGGMGVVDIAVYNVAGRRIRTVTRSAFPAGQHLVLWDGRDDSGALVRSGTYFLRATSAGEAGQLKVVVAR